MKALKNRTWKLCLIPILYSALVLMPAHAGDDDLAKSFENPPETTRPGCYWYWINDNVSKEGITKDLEAMARVGIGRAYIGHIYNRREGEKATPVGKVPFMSEAWWEAVQWAVKEADRCGVEIGFFNSPGWSQSGGPWIKPSQSMRYLDTSETQITGGKLIEIQLPVPEIHTFPIKGGSRPIRMGPDFGAKDFQDVRVIAYPKPESGDLDMSQIRATSTRIKNLSALFDGSEKTTVDIDSQPTVIQFQHNSNEPVQSVQLKLQSDRHVINCMVEISDDGKTFKPWTTFTEERGHQGPRNKDPILVPIKPSNAKHLKLTLSTNDNKATISELTLSHRAVVAHYVRRQLGETCPSTNPSWDAYMWDKQELPAKGKINPDKIVDLTDKMDETGLLKWNAPKGDWIIMRTGMVPIGTYCAPSSPESGGLEVDKMSREHVQSHFESMVGEFLRRTPAEDRKALKYVIADSYETGPQNWTDNFVEKFTKRYGYSPVRFLPCMQGHVVGNVDMSNRFLWDWRRLIAESVAEDYVGGLRDICNEHGLKLWLENYGHWGYPSEFLLYGSMSDQVGGEFWESGGIHGNVECRAAASSSHTYGRTDVYAEAYTSNRNFKQSPAELKSITDWVFASGVNHLILHVYIHQPDEQAPGIIQWFGTAFNRHNTWFDQSKPFIDYIRRSAVMLKAGTPVADVAYYIGQDAPVMMGPFEPALPDGYDFDHINADVLIHHAKVVDGRIHIENGPSYAVLVLPKLETMTPEVAAAIQRLVDEGATVIGPKPSRSPSLENYPECDQSLATISETLWGKGKIQSDISLVDLLNNIGVEPDIQIKSSTELLCAAAGAGKIGRRQHGGIVFKHRHSDERDIYLVANTLNEAVDFTASFRIASRKSSFWNSVTGQIHDVLDFSEANGRTEIPIHLEADESIYVVFGPEPSGKAQQLSNHLRTKTYKNITGPWKVSFNGVSAPQDNIFESLTDWTKHPVPAIQHFSGKASYQTSFTIEDAPDGQPVLLDLGEVYIIAEVSLNGEQLATLWTTPWAIDIGKHLKKGDNQLQITVTSTWNNRLVADSKLPDKQRVTHISQPYRIDSKNPWRPSGLVGPVTLRKAE